MSGSIASPAGNSLLFLAKKFRRVLLYCLHLALSDSSLNFGADVEFDGEMTKSGLMVIGFCPAKDVSRSISQQGRQRGEVLGATTKTSVHGALRKGFKSHSERTLATKIAQP